MNATEYITHHLTNLRVGQGFSPFIWILFWYRLSWVLVFSLFLPLLPNGRLQARLESCKISSKCCMNSSTRKFEKASMVAAN